MCFKCIAERLNGYYDLVLCHGLKALNAACPIITMAAIAIIGLFFFPVWLNSLMNRYNRYPICFLSKKRCQLIWQAKYCRHRIQLKHVSTNCHYAVNTDTYTINEASGYKICIILVLHLIQSPRASALNDCT